MHWFWRAAIAVAAGYVSLILLAGATPHARDYLKGYIRSTANSQLADTFDRFCQVFCIAVPTVLAMILAFVVITCLTKRSSDGETRCRKCGYILRGIREPRCPECGERI